MFWNSDKKNYELKGSQFIFLLLLASPPPPPPPPNESLSLMFNQDLSN